MEAFRNLVRSWWGKAFLFVVLVVFVVFAFGPQFLTPSGAQGEVAEVNGTRIFSKEVDDGVERAKARYGNQVDPKLLDQLVKRDDILEGLIRRRVLIDEARDVGAVVAPETIQELIFSIDAFKDDSGKFSPERFQQLVQRSGFPNTAAFRKQVEEDLLSSQLTGALQDSAFTTRQDLELLTRMGEQKRDFSWIVLSPESLLAEVTATEEEVKARYEQDSAGWMTEEQFAVEYVQVDLDQYAESQTVGEADVRAKYDEMVRQAQSNAERRVADILVKIDADRDDAAALARANEALGKLTAGTTFAKAAAEYSDDGLTRDKGGDLGFLSQGVLDPVLEKAVMALKAGDVSAPVKSGDGYHVMKLLEVRAVEVPDYATQRSSLEAALRRDMAREKFDSVVEELGNLVYESDNLQEPASKIGLVVREAGLFTRATAPGVLANPKVLAEITSADVLEDGRNSAVVRPVDTQAVVVRLKEHRKPQRRPLAEVSALVRQGLLRDKASSLASTRVEEMQKQVVAGKPLAAVAAGLPIQQQAGVQRASQGVPRELVEAGFRVKKPAAGAAGFTTVTLADGSKALLQVGNVVDGSMLGKDPMEIAANRGQLAGEFGRVEFASYLAQVESDADVTRIHGDKDAGGKGVGEMLKELKDKATQRRP